MAILSKFLYIILYNKLFQDKIRVGKTSLIKRITHNTFETKYVKTDGINILNRKAILTNNTEIQLKLIDSPGDVDYNDANILSKILTQIKALYFIIDITNPNSFEKIKNSINLCQKCYDEHNKNNKDAKQPKSFRELPMLIIGNKIDLISERKLKNSDIQNYVNNLQKEKNLVYINYNQVSVKDNKNIEGLYQEILFFYYQQRINTKIAHNPKEEEKTSTSTKSEEKKDIKKPNLNKNMVIFHQMLDKIKQPLLAEISRLKEEHKKDKLNMEKKIQDMMNKVNKEKNPTKEKNANEEKKEDLNLKFKMKDNNDLISIKAKRDSKLFEILNMLCELCPGMENLKIKGFSVEGKKEMKIDEMKTVSENKLEDNTILIINTE